MPVNIIRRELAGTARAPRDGREFVAKALVGQPRADDLVQIASELITNAIRHSHSKRPGGRVAVTVIEGIDFDGIGFAGVKVTDDGSQSQPHVKRSARLEESGYGLALVEELSDRWGHYVIGHRRTVWAAVASS
ncbi:ATP-binding protein [Thermocatellispora tengchongensis]